MNYMMFNVVFYTAGYLDNNEFGYIYNSFIDVSYVLEDLQASIHFLLVYHDSFIEAILTYGILTYMFTVFKKYVKYIKIAFIKTGGYTS